MGKPSKFSRKAGGGVTVKNIDLKDKRVLMNSAHVISFQAKKDLPELQEKIEKGTLKWSAYNTPARRHAFQKELEKNNIKTEKVKGKRRSFMPEYINQDKKMKNEMLRSSLMINTQKRLGCEDFLKRKEANKNK